MGRIISIPLPKDLPENWNDEQYVSPGGVEVGLSEKHGYNYLMKQVNKTQEAVEQLDVGIDNRFHHAGTGMIIPSTSPFSTLAEYIKARYIEGKTYIVAKVNGFPDMPRQEWGYTLIAINGEGDLWDVELIEALTNRRFVRQLNTNTTWLQSKWMTIMIAPLMEEVVFDRDDTLGSARLAKNSSAAEDFGFTIRDYADNGAEARINVVASEQMISAAFRQTGANELVMYELLHTANVGKVAAPAGLVSSTVQVDTDEAITSTIMGWIASMTDHHTKNFVLSVNALNLTLGGGAWFVTINRTSASYATVTVTRYDTSGIIIMGRSLVNGALTGWTTITSSPVLPATVE